MKLLSLFVLPLACFAGDAPSNFQVQVTGDGRPVILIPGLSSSGKVWAGTIEHWKKRYECHVLTLAGFAGAPPVESPSLAKVRDEVAAYIRSRKLVKPVIVGHSLGGFLALWIAATYPDLAGDLVAVDSLPYLAAIHNPGATPDTMRPMAETMRQSIVSMTADQMREYNRSQSFLKSMVTGEENLALVRSWADTSDPRTVGAALYDMFLTDLRPQLDRIKSRVLVIGTHIAYGGRDEIEANFRKQYGTLKGYSLQMAGESRHFVMLDDPKAFYAMLDEFINKK